MANAFIDVESTMYASQRVTNGGWNGKRLFKVIDKVEESEQITSFYFIPVDQQPIRQFKPGQYITVNINGASDYQQKRQYSLSQFEYKNFYRISVKRGGLQCLKVAMKLAKLVFSRDECVRVFEYF